MGGSALTRHSMSNSSLGDRTSKEVKDLRGQPLAVQPFPWLLRQKITIPDPVEGYVHRPELVDRAMPVNRRLTVLKAPSGFGKTVLLAECCRRLRGEGVAVAWVSLDEHDEPPVLDAYVALACASAGLSPDGSTEEEAADGPGGVRTVVRNVESFGRPFVIAFDELERLRHPASLAVVTFLLQRGPPNLHLAIVCRDIPDGLNLASAQLEGRAEALEAEDLRFSATETARFFGLRLSRRALAEEMKRSAGWPFALRVSLINWERGRKGAGGVAQGLVGNWIESRLLADLGCDDREFVLDLGLFEWIDEALLDDVLQRAGSVRRIESMAALTGLIEQVGDGEGHVWRLHPLLREHCAKQRLREDSERSGAIHRRIAQALAGRGKTVQAMRHAIEGGAPSLAGAIVEQAGGVRLWVREGVPQLQAAHRLLSEGVISESPRLMLLSSAALALSGHSREARARYRESVCRVPCSEEANIEYTVDDCVVRGCLALYAGEPVGSDWMQAFSREMARLQQSPHLDALTHGSLEYAFSVLHFLKGELDPALERLSLAWDLLAGTHYIAVYGELVRGQVDFVMGRTMEAESHFRRSQRIARTHFPLDPVAAASGKMAMQEMALECGLPSASADQSGLRKALLNSGVPFSFFATAINILIDSGLRTMPIGQTLALADEVLGHLRRGGLTSFARLLAALRISLLVRAGRIEDADRAWQREALPEDLGRCADLAIQTWREVEALSEARVRLLTAHMRFDDARSLLRALRSVAVERGLRRLEMRALALSIMMEHQAGEAEASQGSLQEYLELFAESPFAWPLVREGTACAEPLKRFLKRSPDSPHGQAARSLLAAMRRMDGDSNLVLSAREREVLALLPGHQVKQVAATIGLSVHGVRFHLRKLFGKLEVSNRSELLDRARELGLIGEPD